MTQNEYIPGICNIGKAEIANRSKKLKISLGLLIISIFFIFSLPFNYALFTFIASCAGYSSILFFQIQQKFCIVLGWKNVFNFKEVGAKKNHVVNEEWKKKDRIMALKILAYSFLLSLGFSLVILVLAKKI